MTFLIYIFLIIGGAMCIQYYMGKDKEDEDAGFIVLSELPGLLSKLYATGNNGSCFVLSVPGTEGRDGHTASLQFSMEGSEIGLDWVLLAERNIHDKGEFLKIVSEYDLNMEEETSNGIDYIRVEKSRELLVSIASQILKEMYGITDSTEMPLAITDFLWR